MIDIRQLRSDPQGVAGNLARRGYALDLEAFTALEGRRKELQVAVDALRNERNTRSKAIGMAKGRGEDVAPLLSEVESLGAKLASDEQALGRLQSDIDQRLLDMPNLLHDTVPAARDSTANVELRRHGEPRRLDFEAADHVAIGEGLGGSIRLPPAGCPARASRCDRSSRRCIVRSRNSFSTCTARARLSRGMGAYLVSRQALTGTGQLPKFEQDLFSCSATPAKASCS